MYPTVYTQGASSTAYTHYAVGYIPWTAGHILWTYPVGANIVVHGTYPQMYSTSYYPRDMVRCCPRDMPTGYKMLSTGLKAYPLQNTGISRGRNVDIPPQCRLRAYPVDNTYPLGYIPWATCYIPWTTYYIPWTHTVDYPYPVGYNRGQHISRGYDIPWTTCTHGIYNVVHGTIYPVGYIPWVNSVQPME